MSLRSLLCVLELKKERTLIISGTKSGHIISFALNGILFADYRISDELLVSEVVSIQTYDDSIEVFIKI